MYVNGVDQGPPFSNMVSVEDTTPGLISQTDFNVTVYGEGQVALGYANALITTHVHDASGRDITPNGYPSSPASVAVGSSTTVPVTITPVTPCDLYSVSFQVQQSQPGQPTTSQTATVYYSDAPREPLGYCSAPPGYTCTQSGGGTSTPVAVTVQYPTLTATPTPAPSPNPTDPPTRCKPQCQY
ncbi:MAG TPA: hypothetical protein VFL13_08290 [Candidatus Baltobacteraceae bacterium]|nr:hypothetical protein [Candidatus Baltobacteraceae bacterium]